MVGALSTLLLLFPVAMGAGVDLFLTITVVLLYTNPTASPQGLVGPLDLQWAVPAALMLLYLAETWMELRPLPALLWHTLQRLLRPLGASLLGWILLEESPPALLLSGMLLMGLVAWFAHGLSWGGKLRRIVLPNPSVSAFTHGLAEDTGTLALLILATEFPIPGAGVALALFILSIPALGHLFQVGAVGRHLLRDRVWGIVSPTGWMSRPHLPSWARGWLRTRGAEGGRGLPGMAWSLPEGPGLRAGWLLEDGSARFFGTFGFRGPRFIPLSGFRVGPPEVSDTHLALPMKAPDGSDSALFLQKGAPVPESHKW